MAHARRTRSAPRIAAALAGVISLALVVGALTGPVASAATSTKFYTGTVTPSTATPGGTQTYTFAIADSSASTQSLGSANINVPADFTSVTVGAVTPPPGKVWTATLVSGQIELRNPGPGSTSRLDPGESVSVLVTATAPTSCGSFTWTINYLTSIAQGDEDGDGLPGLTRPFDSLTGVASGSFTPATIGPYNLTDVGYALNTIAAQEYEVGQKVNIQYQERGLPLLWKRVYVAQMSR